MATHNLEFATLVLCKPNPSRTKKGAASILHLLSHCLEITEVEPNGAEQRAAWQIVGFGQRGELLEVESVIENLSGIIEERKQDVLDGLEEYGLVPVDILQDRGWCCIRAKKK